MFTGFENQHRVGVTRSRRSHRSRTFGLFGSASGVIETPSSQGSPALSLAILSRILATSSSAIDSCTITSLIAVHRCPLYDVAPSTHCAAATSTSASGRTMPRF